MIRILWSFLDLLQQNVDFYGKHQREKDEEDKESERHGTTVDVADGYPCRQHVLDGPRLTSELCYQPATFRGDVGERQEDDGDDVVPIR